MGKENAGDNAALETKWSTLEEHYRDNEPVNARIVKATLQYLLVDVYGVPGVVEMPSFDMAPLGQHVHDHESINRQLDRICGRKILLKIVEMDRIVRKAAACYGSVGKRQFAKNRVFEL